MKTIGNVLWFIFGGWIAGTAWVLAGALCCLTVIGIPFGTACFRIASFAYFPFGKDLVDARDVGEERVPMTGLSNFLWVVLVGLWVSIGFILAGIALCCLVVTIPFGIACFQLAAAGFAPLGKRIVPADIARVIRDRKARGDLEHDRGRGGHERAATPEVGNPGKREADDESPEAGGDGTGGEVFLKKVRLGRKLNAAMSEILSVAERTRLENIRDLYQAGVEAQQAGEREAAGAFYQRTEKALSEWRKSRQVRQAPRPEPWVSPRVFGPEEKTPKWVLATGIAVVAATVVAVLCWKQGIGREPQLAKTLERTMERWREYIVPALPERSTAEAMQDGQREEVEGAADLEQQDKWEVVVAPETAAPQTTDGRQAGDTTIISLPGGASMEMVWCPPGCFTMGSDNGERDEKPPHEVTLTKGFWLAKTEVTQGQWKSVMGSNPAENPQGDDHPVENVSWNDVQEFCRKAGKGLELPTEAEWEYACRAGTTGDYAGDLDQMAWCGEGDNGSTHPVGRKQANGWGLHDMHGNVWEWCADWYDNGYYAQSPGVDPHGPTNGTLGVLRGGCSWFAPQYCRSANRIRFDPGTRIWFIGFRPVTHQHLGEGR